MKPAKKGTQTQGREAIKILFIAGFGPIVRDVAASRKLYGETLGIPFKEEGGGYLHSEALKGAKSFALWPLPQAAQSCFGKDSWLGDVPVPHAWLEFDVDDVEQATAQLESGCGSFEAGRANRMTGCPRCDKRQPPQLSSPTVRPEGVRLWRQSAVSRALGSAGRWS